MPVRVQIADFDLTTEVVQLRAANPLMGAVTCFVGTEGALNDGSTITENRTRALPVDDREGAGGDRRRCAAQLAGHRCADRAPGRKTEVARQIVLVATTSAHRGDAFASCEFVMDYLKMQSPFWKKEKTENGAH